MLGVESASFDCAEPLLIWATFWATPVQVWTRLLKTQYESTTKEALEVTLPEPSRKEFTLYVCSGTRGGWTEIVGWEGLGTASLCVFFFAKGADFFLVFVLGDLDTNATLTDYTTWLTLIPVGFQPKPAPKSFPRALHLNFF